MQSLQNPIGLLTIWPWWTIASDWWRSLSNRTVWRTMSGRTLANTRTPPKPSAYDEPQCRWPPHSNLTTTSLVSSSPLPTIQRLKTKNTNLSNNVWLKWLPAVMYYNMLAEDYRYLPNNNVRTECQRDYFIANRATIVHCENTKIFTFHKIYGWIF